jgi:hypothetical protein
MPNAREPRSPRGVHVTTGPTAQLRRESSHGVTAESGTLRSRAAVWAGIARFLPFRHRDEVMQRTDDTCVAGAAGRDAGARVAQSIDTGLHPTVCPSARPT